MTADQVVRAAFVKLSGSSTIGAGLDQSKSKPL